MMPLSNGLLGQSTEKSALPSPSAATASDVLGGTFFGSTGRCELRGAPGMVRLPERALDENVARALLGGFRTTHTGPLSISLRTIYPDREAATYAVAGPRHVVCGFQVQG